MASFNRTFSNIVLPIAVFLLIIGGTAWMVQYMPNWRSSSAPSAPIDQRDSAPRDVLRFSRPEGQIGPLRAVWAFDADGRDAGYALEYERFKDGHYDIPFKNVLGKPAEIGLLQSDCDCSHAEACLLPYGEWQKADATLTQAPWTKLTFAQDPAWQALVSNETAGFKVPTDGQGLLRIAWKGRKGPGEMLKISLRFWCKGEGDTTVRQLQPVVVPVIMVLPIQFRPFKQSVGVLGPGDTQAVEFHFWSATRENPDVSFQPSTDDPLFQIESERLSPAECQKLQDDLNAKEFRHRVQAAYLVKATLRERKGNLLMDQGPFSYAIPIKLDQLPVEAGTTPFVTGTVRGEVEVGGADDHGKVQLRTFPSADSKSIVVPLYADPKARLELVNSHPACLKVGLKANAKESTAQRARWDLHVSVPAGAWTGPMPESARIMLRVPGDPPRLVRIPVVGTATR